MRTQSVFLSICAVALIVPQSYGDPLEVESFHDGQGKYTYSLAGGDDIVWSFPPNGGFIRMKLPGVVSLISPEGWLGIVGGDDWVTWRAGSTTQSIGLQPVIFGAVSSITAPERYGRFDLTGQPEDPACPPAVLAAQAVHPSASGPVLGYTAFHYLGPAIVVPEPAPLALMGLIGLGALVFRRPRSDADH